MYAILETGGKQYRVAEGDKLTVEKLEVEEGQSTTIDKVLLVQGDAGTKIGAPTVEGASVTAEIVAHQRGPKLIAFKMKRRKGYRRKVGHRQDQTILKVTSINA
ncbi:50S ribosomal protein L21 [Verrucomicrobia bacterium]|nr:50S ribosomal protein L21 [Verrucomicrobiota bacterium]